MPIFLLLTLAFLCLASPISFAVAGGQAECLTPSSRAAGILATAAVSPAAVTEKSTMPPEPYPPGMVWIPGGEFNRGGIGPEARPDEFPVHKVRVAGFWMDATEVSNSEFQRFVEDTGYVTTAEKKPEWEG
jgi:formylglycine-generating enzyme